MYMILSHPRSMSTLAGSYFQNYVGEVFESMVFKKRTDFFPDHAELFTSNRAEFDRLYVEHLWATVPMTGAFKVHYHQIKKWDVAKELIKAWNPTVIAIERRDKLAAILSGILAMRRGFTKDSEVECAPFEVTRDEFAGWYEIVVNDFAIACDVYKAGVVLQGEYLHEGMTVLGRRRLSVTYPAEQRSLEHTSLIVNLKQCREWWSTLSHYRIESQYALDTQ